MKRLLLLIWLVIGFSAFLPHETPTCHHIEQRVVHPLLRVTHYLETLTQGDALRAHHFQTDASQSRDALATFGGRYILTQMSEFSQGVDQLRSLATQKIQHTESQCVTENRSVRYACSPSSALRACDPEPYSYCVEWRYSQTRSPQIYESAFEISTRLDHFYYRIQTLYALSQDWKPEALPLAAELYHQLQDSLLPQLKQHYHLACGGESRRPQAPSLAFLKTIHNSAM